MMVGIDTNVLVYAHLAAFPQHARARARVLLELANPKGGLAISPLVLHEFIHVVTDQRRFEAPLSMSEALGLARGYLGHSNVEILSVDEGVVLLALDDLERRQLGRKRISDSLLAASLVQAGVTEVLTCNPGDFVGFPGLRPIDPLA